VDDHGGRADRGLGPGRRGPRDQASPARLRPDRRQRREQAGRTAVLIRYSGRQAGRPGDRKVYQDTFERYEFYKNGTEAVCFSLGRPGRQRGPVAHGHQLVPVAAVTVLRARELYRFYRVGDEETLALAASPSSCRRAR